MGTLEEEFDESKKYQDQEEVFFDDGREVQLLHFVYGRTDIDNIRGNPNKVLAAIDDFGCKEKYLMNVGETKGRVIVDIIRKHKPNTMVELGGYVGYSSILFGSAMREVGGQRYYTLERSPEFAAVTASLVDLAGLSDIVKVIVGPSDRSIKRLHSEGLLQKIDMLFLDHYKPAYLTDLKLCEELRLVGPCSILVADNVIKPGNPPYLRYVRSSCSEKRNEKHRGAEKEHPFLFPEWSVNQYKDRQGKEIVDEKITGNPNLVYTSRLIHSREPTGVPDGIEVTYCHEEEEPHAQV